MSNPTQPLLKVIAILCLFSCTKSNTEDESIPPFGKKLVSSIGGLWNGDTLKVFFFDYNANNKLVKYSTSNGEAHDYHGYSFARDADNIMTAFTLLDSVQYDGVLHSVIMEHWKPFYDKTQRRYTHAIRTHEQYYRSGGWALDDWNKWRVDSIAYQYTGDKITQIQYYTKSVFLVDGANENDYKLYDRMELQRDAKGRIIQLQNSINGVPMATHDSKFEYDETLNPLYFGDEGIFLIDEHWSFNFHSENNYRKVENFYEEMQHNYPKINFDESGYPMSVNLQSVWPEGDITEDVIFYFYK